MYKSNYHNTLEYNNSYTLKFISINNEGVFLMLFKHSYCKKKGTTLLGTVYEQTKLSQFHSSHKKVNFFHTLNKNFQYHKKTYVSTQHTQIIFF